VREFSGVFLPANHWALFSLPTRPILTQNNILDGSGINGLCRTAIKNPSVVIARPKIMDKKIRGLFILKTPFSGPGLVAYGLAVDIFIKFGIEVYGDDNWR
jgi:hypothetical protein